MTNGIITQYTLSVTSNGRGSNDGVAVNQVEAFNRASAKFCAIGYYLLSNNQTPKMLKIEYYQMLIIIIDSKC